MRNTLSIAVWLPHFFEYPRFRSLRSFGRKTADTRPDNRNQNPDQNRHKHWQIATWNWKNETDAPLHTHGVAERIGNPKAKRSSRVQP